ncbi:MAG: hypothetical protein Ct9H90mP30_5390 [Actinomycetota bacterium]|nr:MAG: hypothetical protein Ct9H90mP30_5390 [Actinomycetota bacterium]
MIGHQVGVPEEDIWKIKAWTGRRGSAIGNDANGRRSNLVN